MIQLAKATPAPKPLTKDSPHVALLLAGVFVAMVCGQLFEFEQFIPLVVSFGLPGGETLATVLASTIVVGEVFALPFLLRMKLSPLMRVVSMVMGWIVVAKWLALSIWLTVMSDQTQNIGLFGTKVMLPVGWWTIFFCTSLVILMGWASWGMWPLKKTHRKSN